MHDLGGSPRGERFEYDFEGEGGVFSESETAQLASELMEVQSEQELEQFLGDLIKKAGHAVGSLIKSPAGQALGGILKSAAKQALPLVGSTLGGLVAGDTGSQLGGKLGSFAGDKLGLEMQGELETAKDFVRMAADAVKNAGAAPPSGNPVAAAKAAVAAAAGQHMPALLSPGARSDVQRGAWVRRGNRIVVMGV